jgi:hypothetical protein
VFSRLSSFVDMEGEVAHVQRAMRRCGIVLELVVSVEPTDQENRARIRRGGCRRCEHAVLV